MPSREDPSDSPSRPEHPIEQEVAAKETDASIHDGNAKAEDGPREPLPPELSDDEKLRILMPSAGAPDRMDAPVPPLSSTADEDAEAGPSRSWTDRLARRETLSSGVSTIIHLSVLLLLALLFIPLPPDPPGPNLISTASPTYDVEMPTEQWEVEPEITFSTQASTSPVGGMAASIESPPISEIIDEGPQPNPVVAPTAEILFQEPSARRGGGIAPRTEEAIASINAESGVGGPTPGSQGAVARGLAWIATHQCEDGGWRFNHNHDLCPCRGQCSEPGTASTTTAATGLALLAFFGAGQTQVQGAYQDTVREGLYYLLRNARRTRNGIDLLDGNMYGHGIATLAIIENYAMTKDPGLKDLAQGAVDFIIYAQSEDNGGWRYQPGQPGDTTVTAWQYMCLKAAQQTGLYVPQDVIYRAQGFFDIVESEGGALYGYRELEKAPRDATTAIGLLCRMYGGWPRSRPQLGQGVSQIEKWGVHPSDLYYDYYATLVLFHYGGSAWHRWNPAMRDYLVAQQSTRGHESGSWYFPNQWGDEGGRLYNTAMAVLILEVYYRYLPLYRIDEQ